MALQNTHPQLSYVKGKTKNTYLYRELEKEMVVVTQQALLYNEVGGKTTWMESNNTMLDFGSDEVMYDTESGAYTFTSKQLVVSGYGDYVRDFGYSMAHSKEETTKVSGKCFVRSIKYKIDARDNRTTIFIDKATQFLVEARNTQLLPEIDSYRISNLSQAIKTYHEDVTKPDADATKVISKKYNFATDGAVILKDVNDAINMVLDMRGGTTKNILIMANSKIRGALRTEITELASDKKELAGKLPILYGKETINYGWNSLVVFQNEYKLDFYEDALMRTKFKYFSGTQGAWVDYTPSKEADGGYEIDADAQRINFMVFPLQLPEAHIFYEVTNADYLSTQEDSYAVAHRIEHDVFFNYNELPYSVISIEPKE